MVGAPGDIEAFVAHVGTLPNSIMLDWANADLAESYHVYAQIVGTDAHFKLNQTVHDSDATVTGLPHGATVRFMVRAVNAHGEGPASDVLEIVVV